MAITIPELIIVTDEVNRINISLDLDDESTEFYMSEISDILSVNSEDELNESDENELSEVEYGEWDDEYGEWDNEEYTDEEIWIPVTMEEFKDHYFVSNYGRIKRDSEEMEPMRKVRANVEHFDDEFQEEWKPLPGFENYQISCFGRIKNGENKLLKMLFYNDDYYNVFYFGSGECLEVCEIVKDTFDNLMTEIFY